MPERRDTESHSESICVSHQQTRVYSECSNLHGFAKLQRRVLKQRHNSCNLFSTPDILIKLVNRKSESSFTRLNQLNHITLSLLSQVIYKNMMRVSFAKSIHTFM